MSLPELLVDVVALSGGRLVGRTRMQKTVYILDAKGLNSGAAYFYHNYGPFSDEVANGISDSKFRGQLVEKVGQRQSDGSPFSIFETEKPADQVQQVGDLDRDQAIALLQRLAGFNSTVLELAATIHWLATVEQVDDWRSELKKRKGSKTAAGRMEKAEAALAELGLEV